MANKEVQVTLEDAVAEVLNSLTGLDVTYDPNHDRFQAITRALNRALRFVALEHEWSYYSSTEEIGGVIAGNQDIELNASIRPRIINDDCVRLIDGDGTTRVWAYFLPRDALGKYAGRRGLWCSVTRSTLTFSRPFRDAENGWKIKVPVMREPVMFRLPKAGNSISNRILQQPVDFEYPDLVIYKAAQFVAEADPVMQPRVQMLEAKYKDIMYQLVERDDRATDSPYENDFMVPIQNDVSGFSFNTFVHPHPHADERYS